MIKEYFDEIRSGIVNVLTNLRFNGADVLTSTKTDGRNLPIKNVADPVDQQDVVTKEYLEANGSGGVATVNDKSPTSGNVNVTIDDAAKKGATSSVAVSVPQDSYGPTWAGNSEIPTKGDVYAEMEQKANSNATGGGFVVELPAADSVANRVAGAVEGTDYPNGWVLTDDDKDLVITHGIEATLFMVTVFNYTTGDTQQLRQGAAAYTGLYDYGDGSIRIQSLATVNSKIAIKLYLIG